MKKFITYSLAVLSLVGGLTSCDKFLDKLPDNRTELNSTEKIQKLLVSAYASRTYVRFFEYASDNCELYSEGNKNTSRLIEQNYNWEPIEEADNESNVNTWQAYYNMIATANAAPRLLPSRALLRRCSLIRVRHFSAALMLTSV